jgi:hypothetical protein
MKTFLAIISLIIILGLSVAAALYVWIDLGDVEISTLGTIAMGAGIGLSLLVGIGLMMLVYHSARSGHDEKVDELVKNVDEK